jgi:error-prone DNA polymerase
VIRYAPLSVFSNYSFLEGASFPEELVARAAAFDLPAIAITDRDGMYGIIRAHVTARELGIKLLVGATVTRSDGPPVTLLATSKRGYANICRTITIGRSTAEKGTSRVTTRELLHSCGRHVILIHPALHQEAHTEALKESFGNRFYAGIARTMTPGDEHRIEAIKEGARRFRLPLVAAPSIFFHHPNRKDLSDALCAIRHQQPLESLAGQALLPNANFTLSHPSTFRRLYQDIPGAVERTVEIADRCNFSLAELRYHYPREVVPTGQTPMNHLHTLTFDGARTRYPGGIPGDVRQQLEHELRLIDELQYANYFLTMYDIVAYARGLGILCQGRGSAANSAVCYVLEITSVDPVRSNLLFERFISKERDEPPDIDVDFEHERREEVIQYIYRRYGRQRAAMVAEFIRYRTRSAIRDVGKALGFSLPQVTRLSNLAASFRRDQEDWWEAAVRSAGFAPEHPRLKFYHSLVRRIQAFPRHLSIHVGGFIISDIPVDNLVPVEPARMDERTVIQWDKEDVEDAGLLKIDILGLGMLTCIRKTFDLLREGTGIDLDLATVPAGDEPTYRMIRAADTVGVFQIESRAQMSMLPRLRPANFYDLVVEIAIVRPGPIQGKMVHPYLRRRQGLEPVTYPLPELEPVLGRTFGVPLFQEQVMKLAMVAGGFTGGEADHLRRAMGTWRSNGRLNGLLDKLIKQMEDRGLTPEYAKQIADQIRGFGEYGFPESHAASFALLAYASSYLKCHHPAFFAAALINSQPMGFYSPASIVEDARRHEVPVLPICINASSWDCSVEAISGDSLLLPTSSHPPPTSPSAGAVSSPADCTGTTIPALRIGFRLVRGLRANIAEGILEERQTNGAFESLEALIQRTRAPTHALLKLALAGAFAGFGFERRAALWQVLSKGQAHDALFTGHPIFTPPDKQPELNPWETVLADVDATCVFLSQHPFELVYPRLQKRRNFFTAEQLKKIPHKRRVLLGGLSVIKQRPPTAGGVLFMTLEDHTGFHNLVIYRQVFQRYRQTILEEPVILVQGILEKADGIINIKVEKVTGIHLEFARQKIQMREFR